MSIDKINKMSRLRELEFIEKLKPLKEEIAELKHIGCGVHIEKGKERYAEDGNSLQSFCSNCISDDYLEGLKEGIEQEKDRVRSLLQETRASIIKQYREINGIENIYVSNMIIDMFNILEKELGEK